MRRDYSPMISFISIRLVAVVVLALPVVAYAKKSGSVTIKYPLLISACQVAKTDKYFKDAPILVLAVNVGAPSSYLYEHVNGRDKFLAEMHYDEGGLDAEGGTWSIYRASDVYNYLIKKPFTFIGTKNEYEASELLKQPTQCAIDYKDLDNYDNS
jgi:hypothetical protein